MTDKAVHGEVVIATLVVNRLHAVSTTRTPPSPVSRAAIPRIPRNGTRGSAGLAAPAVRRPSQSLKRVGLRDENRQQKPGGGDLTESPILVKQRSKGAQKRRTS